jgi:uncharacterized protein YcbK (DUF882 family)
MKSAHFTDAELACHHGINRCQRQLVDALEALRKIVGPIKINDAFRCDECNAKVGGARDSQHRLGMAADIEVAGLTARQLYREVLKIPAFKGIGVSQHRYVHVDTRWKPARWSYNAAGKESPWDASLDEGMNA